MVMVKETDPVARSYLGQALIDLRQRARLSQERLAKISNMSRGTIRNIESGTTHPDTTTLILLADGLTRDADGTVDPSMSRVVLNQLSAADYLDRTGVDSRSLGIGQIPSMSTLPTQGLRPNITKVLDASDFDAVARSLRVAYAATPNRNRQAIVQVLDALQQIVAGPTRDRRSPSPADLALRGRRRSAPLPIAIRRELGGRDPEALLDLCASRGLPRPDMDAVLHREALLDETALMILASALSTAQPDETATYSDDVGRILDDLEDAQEIQLEMLAEFRQVSGNAAADDN